MTKIISGHPLLIPFAIESAKNWRFKSDPEGPFNGVIEVDFSLGRSKAQVEAEREINLRYFAEADRCREALSKQDAIGAVSQCKTAVEWAEKLPKERTNERMSAYALAGNAYLAQNQAAEALRYYETEFKVGIATLRDDQAELAYAYHHVAIANHMLGRITEATNSYTRAEMVLQRAHESIGLAELKPRYAARLKQIREHHLSLLRSVGKVTEAAELERRTKSER